MTREEIVQGLFRGDGRAIKEAIKTLEQEPCEDVMTIHTQGLDEGIRCAMCTNSMKSDRGCDGGCVVNEAMYKEVMNTIRNHIVPPVTPQPKTGHWIEKAEDYYKAINEYGGGVDENTDYFTDDIACPKCLSKFSTIDNETERFRHCPNCGAKMIDLQESEG